MLTVTPYLFFIRSCRDAMSFYQQLFGGELTMMTYGQAQGEGGCPQGAKDLIIHAALRSGSLVLMASDTPDDKLDVGNNMQLSLAVSDLPEFERLYKSLSEKGEATVPPHDAFWGARFGMLTDRFGMRWMLTCEQNKKNSNEM